MRRFVPSQLPFTAAHHPGQPLAPQDWLQGDLFERRVVFVSGYLDGPAATRVAAQLMTLDATGIDPVDIYVDSPDAMLEAAFVLIDTLDLLQAPTRTHSLGQVGGAAIGVLAIGGQRTATPHAGFQLREPAMQLRGTTRELLARGLQQRMLLQRLHERLADATGRPADEIADDMRRGRYLDAREALAYGLIDAIADSRFPGTGSEVVRMTQASQLTQNPKNGAYP